MPTRMDIIHHNLTCDSTDSIRVRSVYVSMKSRFIAAKRNMAAVMAGSNFFDSGMSGSNHIIPAPPVKPFIAARMI